MGYTAIPRRELASAADGRAHNGPSDTLKGQVLKAQVSLGWLGQMCAPSARVSTSLVLQTY